MEKSRSIHRAILCLGFILCAPVAVPWVEAGQLSGELTGHLPAGTYTIVGDISVRAGRTLTLASGVIFLFEEGWFTEYEFDVFGTLKAIGTASHPIVFKPAAGVSEFNYIRIASSSTRLSHTIIEGAGKSFGDDRGGLWIDNSSPLVENTTVKNGKWHGVYVSGASARPVFRNCQITDNADEGLRSSGGAGIEMINSVITGNGGDGINLSNGQNTIVGTVVAANGEDGIDCNGTSDFDALLVNTTVGPHPSEALSDAGNFHLVNCLVVSNKVDIGSGVHTYIVNDLAFFGFENPEALDFRLGAGSPGLNAGTRFGIAAEHLPAVDLDGNPRQNGIVDLGAYESTAPPSTGEEGRFFSKALIRPRMSLPEIRVKGEMFTVQIARLGIYSTTDASVSLVNPLGQSFPMSVLDVSYIDILPGSDYPVQIYGMGVERIQEIDVLIPETTPADFYDIKVTLGTHNYHSINAVSVLESYPVEWGFIHISDPHIGYDKEEETQAERLGVFVREANFLNPEFIVVTGDLCEDLNLGNYFPDTLLTRLSHLRVPVFLIPGNHDYYNDGYFIEPFNPYGYMRYYQEINRYMNYEFRFGSAHFFGLTSGQDLGLLHFFRGRGPTDEALDWVETRLAGLEGDGPLFFMTHGPTYDYVTWSLNNTARVRDILATHGFSLALAGHGHRSETFLNEGENYLGRNDFDSDHDWGRDVPFPGYPLHAMVTTVGKLHRIPVPVNNNEDSDSKILPDTLGWRWVQVAGNEVEFFTCDTDGDGFRNTEIVWTLGRLQFSVQISSDGVITSIVENRHHELWRDVLHYIPAEPGVDYEVAGGRFIRQYPDGTVEVAVDEVAALSSSVVILTPYVSIEETQEAITDFRLHKPFPNPFSRTVSLGFDVPAGGSYVAISIFDLAGRKVQGLVNDYRQAGRYTIPWDGRDYRGRLLPAGIYICLMHAGDFKAVHRLVVVR